MSKQYLDKTGLSYFWGKIKAYVDAHGGNSVGWEYVGNVGSNIFNGSWTADYDGIMVLRATANTSGSIGYWYVKDSTANFEVANLFFDSANGTQRSTAFPVIAGHTYTTSGAAAIYGANGQYYKFST